jgi:hypothetical protein
MKTRKARTRRAKQRRQRSRRLKRFKYMLKTTGGGNTLERNIPKEAVIANPLLEDDMKLKSDQVSIP